MRNSGRYLLICAALVLCGMRDPFHPPDDPCATAALSQWRYHGMAEGRATVGIMQDGQQRWHRLKTLERFPEGWRITAINTTELVVDVGDICEPKQWTWQREGTKTHEIKDSAAAVSTQ